MIFGTYSVKKIINVGGKTVWLPQTFYWGLTALVALVGLMLMVSIDG